MATRDPAGTPDGEPVKVLYLGGYSRSGSTLFDRMLGQVPSFASTGEIGRASCRERV